MISYDRSGAYIWLYHKTAGVPLFSDNVQEKKPYDGVEAYWVWLVPGL